MADIIVHIPKRLGAVYLQLFNSYGEPTTKREVVLPKLGQMTFPVPREGEYVLQWQPVGGQPQQEKVNVAEELAVITLAADKSSGDKQAGSAETLPTSSSLSDYLTTSASIDLKAAQFSETLSEFAPTYEATIIELQDNPKRRSGPRSPVDRARRSLSTTAGAKEQGVDAWSKVERRLSEKRRRERGEFGEIPVRAEYANLVAEEAKKQGSGRLTFLYRPAIRKRFTIGLASDTTPVKYGGWRPYFGPAKINLMRDGERIRLFLHTDADMSIGDGEGIRTRASISLQKRYVRRFLVPLFSGGVEVSFRVNPSLESDVTSSVLPVDPDLRVLVQALVSSSMETAEKLVDRGTLLAESSAEVVLARIDTVDPWQKVVLGLVAQRYSWDDVDFSWYSRLAENFPWISDAAVLAAWWSLRNPTRESLSYSIYMLKKARRCGAPYFSDTNTLMRDLLLSLSNDADDERIKGQAADELRRWRKLMPYQARSGASFAWLTKAAEGATGRLQGRYDKTLYEGTL